MSKYTLIFLILPMGLFLPAKLLANAPLLPDSLWYTVVYQPQTDTLEWINASGEQGQMPRPRLPDEAKYLDLWAKGDEWILFLSDDWDNNRYWNIIQADGMSGSNSHIPPSLMCGSNQAAVL